MTLFIEQATQELLSQGAMVIILSLGMYLMYRHFKEEVTDLKRSIQSKDELIERQHKELSELLKKDTVAQSEMTAALNSLTKIIELWVRQ
jgi:ABC-type nickel/cobalt efflux system permease component RcnA